MYFPRSWVRTTRELETEEGKLLLEAWGFGEDETQARAEAGRRLDRVSQHLLGGAADWEYDYGKRPLREEVLQVLGAEAVITRNRQGAVVLNTAKLLFLDVDLPPANGPGLLGRLFGKKGKDPKDPAEAAIERLRGTLGEAAPGVSFRLYRTCAGLRALALDREFDPVGAEAQTLMQRTGTDESFARLCRSQKSFRARLTPKPWRCDCPKPPGEHPRVDRAKAKFADWCKRYERSIEGRTTCRFLGVVGRGTALATLKPLIELHDQATRCESGLPLA